MKIIFLLISIFFLSGCGDKVNKVDSIPFTIESDSIEVYSNVELFDILQNVPDDVIILSNNYKIDTDVLGKKAYEILYSVDKKKYSFEFEANVVDTEKPVVFSSTNRTILKGYDKNLCDLITYGDNYTGDVGCTIGGTYDLNQVGTYNLIYSLSDSSNNVNEVNVTLNVVSSLSNSLSHTIYTTPITEAFELYKEDNNEIGIDVSEWQGDIDFNKVKDSGVTFVIIRIGVQTNDGVPKLDNKYLDNIKKATDAGLKVGVYLYSIAGSIEEAKEQADWVIQNLDGQKLDLGITFDWENWRYWNSYKISFHNINEIANTFMDKVKESGYDAMLYGSKFYLEKIWTNEKDYPVWLAHYVDYKTDYMGKYRIWQLCNNGRIDGINGDVDIDILYSNY